MARGNPANKCNCNITSNPCEWYFLGRCLQSVATLTRFPAAAFAVHEGVNIQSKSRILFEKINGANLTERLGCAPPTESLVGLASAQTTGALLADPVKLKTSLNMNHAHREKFRDVENVMTKHTSLSYVVHYPNRQFFAISSQKRTTWSNYNIQQ